MKHGLSTSWHQSTHIHHWGCSSVVLFCWAHWHLKQNNGGCLRSGDPVNKIWRNRSGYWIKENSAITFLIYEIIFTSVFAVDNLASDSDWQHGEKLFSKELYWVNASFRKKKTIGRSYLFDSCFSFSSCTLRKPVKRPEWSWTPKLHSRNTQESRPHL